MSPIRPSPGSSCDSGDSVDGTPYTKLTAFSPEDVRSTKPSSSAVTNTPARGIQHDPFISSSVKPKMEQKLSATASAFQPFGLRAASLGSTASGFSAKPSASSMKPIPGTRQYLNAIIEGYEAANLEAAKKSPSSALGDSNIWGTFTTDTSTSRNLKVMTNLNVDIMPLVSATIAVSQILFNLKIPFLQHVM